MLEEKVETTEEVVEEIVEETVRGEGDEVEVKFEEEMKEPEEEPLLDEEGNPIEAKPEVEPVEPVVEPEKYQGKSREDIIKMHESAESEMDRRGTKLGELQKKVDEQPLTDQQVLEQSTSGDIEASLKSEKVKLLRLDPTLDEDKYTSQQDVVSQLEIMHANKRIDEGLKTEMNSTENQRFKIEQKQRFDIVGIKLSDNEFDEIAEIAENHTLNGRFTEASFHHAILDKFGQEKYVAYFTTSGEQKAREGIRDANAKTDTQKVDVAGEGKKGQFKKVAEMGYDESMKWLETASDEQIKDAQTRLNR